MSRMKTFFIYFILVVAFFLFSKLLIDISINTTYSYKDVKINSNIEMQAEVQATSINGFAKGTIFNNTDTNLENKYLKIECYSKNNNLMGTKYIKIDNIKPKEKEEFEVRFNYNKVERAQISVVDEINLENNVNNKDKLSDPEMGLATAISALILLYFI